MGLLMISEIMNDICKVSHSFTNEEKEFIVQFAFKTSDKELTNKLIDELVESVDEADSKRIMEKYSVMYDVKPAWVSQIENLLVSIEMYRIQEQKAINRLAEVLGAYGIDVSVDEVRAADSDTIKVKIAENQRETEAKRRGEKNLGIRTEMHIERTSFIGGMTDGRRNTRSGTDYSCRL